MVEKMELFELAKLEELTEIRKELQNIRVILQSQFGPEPSMMRRCLRDGNGELVKDENGNILREPREDPLEPLRKKYEM